MRCVLLFLTAVVTALRPIALELPRGGNTKHAEKASTIAHAGAAVFAAAPTSETQHPTATMAPTRTETYAPTRMTEAPSYAPTTDTYTASSTPSTKSSKRGIVSTVSVPSGRRNL